MSLNEKLLFVWIVLVVAFSLVSRHFWATAADELGRVLALSLVCLPGLAKLVAGVFGAHLLP